MRNEDMITGKGEDCVSAGAPSEEYQRRVLRIQGEMERRSIGAVLLTSEDNFRYVSGFDSPTWLNPARPRYCIVSANGEVVLIVPTTNLSAVGSTSWVSDVRSWVSPNPPDDGISLVLDVLRGITGSQLTIGAELGPQSRLGMPVGDFLRLREELGPARIVDADGILRDLRKIKSAYEVSCIRSAAQACSRAFVDLACELEPGCSEVEAVGEFQKLLLRSGVDRAPYLVAESGLGGYPSLQMSPTHRRLHDGCVLGIDAGCCRNGYFSDLNRNFAFRKVPDRLRHISGVLWRATEAGIGAAVVGARASDVWRAQAGVLDAGLGEFAARRAENGRMGHGVGLRLTEPPSVHPSDDTILAPGMVLAIEPAAQYEIPAASGVRRCMLVHEENIVVTADGPEILSLRAPGGFLDVG
jgi:Xaa-Pro dipeptidase